MFSQKKPAPDPSKIRLPKASLAPTMAELQGMHDQALETGREVELIWAEPDSTKAYSMSTRFEAGAPSPTWTLWEDDGTEGRLVWKFETSDFELVNDVVCMLKKPKAAAQQESAPAEPEKPKDPFLAVRPASEPKPADPFQSLSGGNSQMGTPQNPYQSQTRMPQQGGTDGGYKPGFFAQQGGASSEPPAPAPTQPAMRNPYLDREDPDFPSPNALGPESSSFPPKPMGESQFPSKPVGEDSGIFVGKPVGDGGGFPTSKPMGDGGKPTEKPMGSAGLPTKPSDYPSIPVKHPGDGVYAAPEKKADTIEGSLADMAVPALLQSLSSNQATGKLEIIGEEAVGEVFFEMGKPRHASTPTEYGDEAIKELVTWEKGTYAFTNNARTEMRSVDEGLTKIIADGVLLLDQKRHLKRAGLGYESYLIRLHKNLSDTELKLMLTKGAPLDFDFQKDIYQYLRHKRTFTDLLRDKPMDSGKWTALLFNFLSCGLIEIKQPDAIKGSALDFLGDARGQVQAIHESFIRPETGVYTYPALMYFLEYEMHRFEAYNFPLSLIVFEIRHRREGTSAADVLTSEAATIAAMRIDLVKRPLDVLGHFETVDYGLLLPNTTGSSAAFVANRILESLTATPLIKGVDRNSLELAFGVSCLPADGDDLESLVMAAKSAKKRAKSGQFPIVLSRSKKSS
ncbi:MAG TPA: DUF4388 domain-containing protein [Drouetiella sp.]